MVDRCGTTLFILKSVGLHWAENPTVGLEIELFDSRLLCAVTDVARMLMQMHIPVPYMNRIEGVILLSFWGVCSGINCEGEVKHTDHLAPVYTT